MRNVEYKVGKNGYYTTCRTLASAKAQAENDLEIKTVLVEAESGKPNLSPMREAMIKQFGRVSKTLREKVVL